MTICNVYKFMITPTEYNPSIGVYTQGVCFISFLCLLSCTYQSKPSASPSPFRRLNEGLIDMDAPSIYAHFPMDASLSLQ